MKRGPNGGRFTQVLLYLIAKWWVRHTCIKTLCKFIKYNPMFSYITRFKIENLSIFTIKTVIFLFILDKSRENLFKQTCAALAKNIFLTSLRRCKANFLVTTLLLHNNTIASPSTSCKTPRLNIILELSFCCLSCKHKT